MIRLTLHLLGIFIWSSTSFAQETVQIRGDVQIWQRVCTTADLCEGRFITSDRMAISATLIRPASNGELAIYEEEFLFHNTKLIFQTFWRLGSESVTGHLAHQISLSLQSENQAELPLSRCTVYQPVKDPAFPVGACTGFQIQGRELIQYGATLWKASTIP